MVQPPLAGPSRLHVLLVEDDPALGEFLQRVLTEEGCASVLAPTLTAGRAALDAQRFDAIVLDWMLPDGDGVAWCQSLAARPMHPPVLMLTARGEVADRVRGLRSGADDYLTKPFEVDELLARLDALVRRTRAAGELRIGSLVLHRLAQRALVDGAPLDLTAKEFALLARLAQDLDRPVDRGTLLRDVWGLRFDPNSGLLEVHISRLRDKLGAEARRIETVRGVGYRLRNER